jgi:hypothetical protein
MYSVYTKIKPFQTVRVQYIDAKKEREIIKEKVIQEYTKLFGQMMCIYHHDKLIKGITMLHLTIKLFVRGINYTREESVTLYFERDLPDDILQSIKQTQITVQLSDRVRLKTETEHTSCFVKML